VSTTTVLKIGGELIEQPDGLVRLAGDIVRLAATGPLVVVHGGGRAIDAELARRGIASRAVDGLRVTDAATLDVVVAVLAGLVNTRLIAAIGAAGGPGVGLTGADAGIVRVRPAPPLRTASGAVVDLGLVGQPKETGPPALLIDLCASGYIPVVASLGAAGDGTIFNVNADTLAAHLAAALGAGRLIVAGATTGVLDEAGHTIPVLDVGDIDRLVAGGRASAGMVAKLDACRHAWQAGVGEIRIVDGRGPAAVDIAPGTRLAGQRPVISFTADPADDRRGREVAAHP